MSLGVPAKAPPDERVERRASDNARSGEAFLRPYDYPIYGVLTGIRLFILGYAVYLFFFHLTEPRFIPIALISVPLLLPAFFDQMFLYLPRAAPSPAVHRMGCAWRR
jgi:hypothetical protein